MKTVITLAVGFWIGRSVYIHYDRQTALKKEQAIKKRLKSVLTQYGLSNAQVNKKTREIIGEN